LKHKEKHPVEVDGCFGCKVLGVRMGANSTTTRGAAVSVVDERAKRWDKDMPAYKRLRQQGYQPRAIDGSAEVERKAVHDWQVNTGLGISKGD
jgi:hypothetical protein